jgi:hypothetical protein
MQQEWDDENQDGGLNEYHSYLCAFCGEENEVWIDGSLAEFGGQTRLTEDCAICCRPNLIIITISRNGDIFLDVEAEYDA